ncbi:MAG: ShlB/FhaC/HecB family hemolysin secretion/activation protein [Firmicutes bacterium]|nr:ShlB/FhaC/HecB family hemolysin secretion/activation protein [Bacillota bacterium]
MTVPGARNRRGLHRRLAGLLLITALSIHWSGPGALAAPAVYVRQVRLDESEILPARELEAIVESYEGREVTLADLEQMVDRINALYEARPEYIARAVLPPQELGDGVVTVRLVEGHIGAIRLEGNAHTREEFILNHIGLLPGQLVRLDLLEERIAHINRIHDIWIRAELRPGQALGTTDYVLHVFEPPNRGTQLFAESQQDAENGGFRGGLTWSQRSLTGRRDPLTVTATGGASQLSLSLAYAYPLGTAGTRLGISVAESRSRVLEGDLAHARLGGASTEISLEASRPFLFRGNSSLRGYLLWSTRRSATLIAGEPVVETGLQSLSARLEYQEQRGATVQRAVPQITAGGEGALDDFVTYHLEYTRFTSRPSGGGMEYLVRLQYSPDRTVPAGYQFTLGGFETLRGYPASVLTGTSGYFLRAEYRRPFNDTIEGLVFLDHGGVQRSDDDGSASEVLTLSSVGVGVTIVWRRLAGRLTVGVPLNGEHARVNVRLEWTF